MARRRILTALKISELSGVDRPCQEGALVSIMKRADGDPIEDFVKVTFQAALDEANLEQRFNRAFYDSFESIYQLNDAFREALKDRYNDGESTAQAYVQAVADLAQRAVAATSGLAKSDSPDSDIIKAAIEAAITEAQEETDMNLYTTRAALVAAIAKFQKDGGTQAEIDKITKSAAALEAEDALPADGALAKKVDLSAELAALKAQVSRGALVAALAGDVRKHYDTLGTDAERDAFLALDATAKAAVIEKASGADPVLYTMADGMEITKSMGPAALLLARGQDAMAKRLDQVSGALINADLSKRAATTLGNLPGTEATKVGILKAIDAIEDVEVRKAALETLTAANKARAGAFTRTGTSATTTDLGKSAGGDVLVPDELNEAEAALDKMARDAMPQHDNDFFKSYAAVVETPEGRALYGQISAGTLTVA